MRRSKSRLNVSRDDKGRRQPSIACVIHPQRPPVAMASQACDPAPEFIGERLSRFKVGRAAKQRGQRVARKAKSGDASLLPPSRAAGDPTKRQLSAKVACPGEAESRSMLEESEGLSHGSAEKTASFPSSPMRVSEQAGLVFRTFSKRNSSFRIRRRRGAEEIGSREAVLRLHDVSRRSSNDTLRYSPTSHACVVRTNEASALFVPALKAPRREWYECSAVDAKHELERIKNPPPLTSSR